MEEGQVNEEGTEGLMSQNSTEATGSWMSPSLECLEEYSPVSTWIPFALFPQCWGWSPEPWTFSEVLNHSAPPHPIQP